MSGLNLTLTAGRAPAQAPLPGNAQALLNFIASYVGISGTQTFNGINFGSTTPSADNRGLPWFKTDAFGNPIGLFSWNGTAWVAIPVNVGSGATAQRPASPSVGTEYFDTSIGALIIYTSQGWSTASGTPGDVKDVKFATIEAALVANPGWVQDTASIGLVIGQAGDATSITAAHGYGTIIGEENHTLAITEMPGHTHQFTGYLNGASADGNTGPGGILSDHNPAAVTQSTGGGQGHNNIQPTIWYFRLVKQF